MDSPTPFEFPETAVRRDVYSVSRLNSEVRGVLSASFPLLWVEGEISNLAQPRSGHVYFSLKDAHAQVRCAMFRMRRQLLRFLPQDGMRVVVRARVNLFEPRGDFQLTIESMEPAGEGALRQAFETLKLKLAAEGLFDSRCKQALPLWPKQIGVITSPSGAAVRDVLAVLRRRFPSLPVVIYPTRVQGEGAAAEISAALRLADQRGECDLLILTRGGGSLEDLMAFNDESLARCIFAARLPIIAAVGHEVDFSIADFVADYRAATPSAAAEAASPDGEEIRRRLSRLGGQCSARMMEQLQRLSSRLQGLEHRLRLQHPSQRLQLRQQRLDELELRLEAAMQRFVRRPGEQLVALEKRLASQAPLGRLRDHRQRLGMLSQRLQLAAHHSLQQGRGQLEALSRELHAVSPLAVLGRGYSITSRADDGRIVTQAAHLSPGDRLRTRLAEGEVVSVVTQPD